MVGTEKLHRPTGLTWSPHTLIHHIDAEDYKEQSCLRIITMEIYVNSYDQNVLQLPFVKITVTNQIML